MSVSTQVSRSGQGDAKITRRVLVGTVIGTTIEWYDFFVYATTAALVFGELFFEPLGRENAVLNQVVAFATIGISFLFRPLGAVIAGHLGDRLGRKQTLVLTLLLMGGATTAMGLLPTYAQIGFWAPLILMVLRILQGLSAGGEWGGAALMSVEHAPRGRRGISGAYPQIGAPIGMFTASLAVSVMTVAVGMENFVAWGWRIPFLLSAVLILAGYIIRRATEESPVFEELRARRRELSAPLRVLVKKHPWEVVRGALVFAGNNAAGWVLIAYIPSYGVNTLGLAQGEVFAVTGLAAAGWVATTLWGGSVSDRLGRGKTFQIGYVALIVWMIPMFLLIEHEAIWSLGVAVVALTFGLGFSYGPLSALYAEMFPAEVRYSGTSISYALGTIVGGAFAPMIAEILLASTGWSPSIGLYLMALAFISLLAVRGVQDRRDAPLT
ncbi:MFS transporter [Saccharomonospora viridis]|jgi:MFS family permease|uniref:MFS transporter n=1 Tax=Saccharomonospora viridis TaxID=1852 RepID=UPI00240A2262|nr:MFS transporter [Saccharomonospora viridis]